MAEVPSEEMVGVAVADGTPSIWSARDYYGVRTHGDLRNFLRMELVTRMLVLCSAITKGSFPSCC